jgi:hypothetical protein
MKKRRNKREYLPGDQYNENGAGSMDTGFRHSSHYHDYFEGYTEKKVEKPNGGYRIERLYTAPWIERMMPNREQKNQKIIFWCLYLLSVLLYLWCMVQRVGSNNCRYVALPGLVCVIPLLLLFFKLVSYTLGKRKMTIYEYKSTVGNFKRLCIFATCTLTATAIMVVVYMFLHIGEQTPQLILNAFLLALSAVLMLCIFLKERTTVYGETKNEAGVIQGGFEIR